MPPTRVALREAVRADPLLERATTAIRQVEPGAHIVLFGSRARGTADEESDWDLLVLLDGTVDTARQDRLRDALLEIEHDTGEVLMAIVKSRNGWAGSLDRALPLYANVKRDGIPLGTEKVEFLPVNEERSEVVGALMQHARNGLIEADMMANIDHWNACVNRLYYACFYGVSALLARDGSHASKHTGVKAQLHMRYVRTGAIPVRLGKMYNELFEHRLAADYAARTWYTESQVRPWLDHARAFVAHVEVLLAR